MTTGPGELFYQSGQETTASWYTGQTSINCAIARIPGAWHEATLAQCVQSITISRAITAIRI
jgi:hypothetical protein